MKKILIITAITILVLINFQNDSIIIPESAIRFRVIAASNTIDDQINKNKVSLELEKYLINLMENANNASESKDILKNNYDNINNYIDSYLNINNLNNNYKLSIGKNYFPKKSYKGVKYKSGYYDSVVLTLGEGNGVNWWCVIYPPLCLIDEDNSDVEYTTLAKELIEKYK